MPPLAHTVSFIDHEQGDAALAERLDVFGFGQPLRRDKDDVVIAFRNRILKLALFALWYRGIEARRWNVRFGEMIELVLHQGDQRRYDDDRTLQIKTRQLITQRLARPGRQNAQRAPARERTFDELTLTRSELVNAEAFARGRFE